MNRRERLIATLRGEPTDRPAVSFYELNGLDEINDDGDPFNIYSYPSWHPLLDLTREKTDRIVMRGVAYASVRPGPIASISETETYLHEGSLFTIHRVRTAGRTLTSRTRRDPGVNTEWTEEHLLKDVDDLKALLEVPEPSSTGSVDISSVIEAEAALGDTGIVKHIELTP